MDAAFGQLLHVTTRAIEVAGVAVIVIGMFFAAFNFLKERSREGAYHELRATLGRAILLGLELLVAADIINTVAIEPTLDSLAVLAGIVLIRTFLSFSLEVEIEGKWPWQQARPTSGHSSENSARTELVDRPHGDLPGNLHRPQPETGLSPADPGTSGTF